MKGLYGVTVLMGALVAPTTLLGKCQPVVAAASPSPTGIKNVVLLRGALADGSGWAAVAKLLEQDGYIASVARPQEVSHAEDQKYTKGATDAVNGSVVLVGHSYGGSIMPEAGNHPKVATLVHIAAFTLHEGESRASIEQAVPQASKSIKPDSKRRTMLQRAAHCPCRRWG